MIRLRVKEVAKEKGMSMGGLARKADIDKNTLRTMYHEPYKVVKTDTLDKLAIALGVDVRELLESVVGVEESNT